MAKKNKILVVGDLHFRENLGYHNYIKDNRISEKKEILDFIIKQSADCDSIIFLGDQLNNRNNPSEVIRAFVEFVEKFGDKKIVFIAGNHEKGSDSKTAIDFLYELKNKNWTVVTDKIVSIEDMTFCPYFTKSELGVRTDDNATKKIMEQLKPNKRLFVHHAISDSISVSGASVNIFHEPILPRKELEKKFKLIIGGHIHAPQATGNTVVAGSIFNQEVGEHQKYIWKIGEDKLTVEQIKLPGRGIYKLENPKDLKGIPPKSIVKVILTEKRTKADIEKITKELDKFDGSLLLEQYKTERKKLAVVDNILDYTVDKLLEVYAKEKKVDIKKLTSAFELIKK